MSASDIREILGAEPTLRLPDGVTVLDVAEACRRATISFASSTVPDAEEKRALATWLVGPYRELCSFVSLPAFGGSATTGDRSRVATPSRQERIAMPVRTEQVKELYALARAHVLGVIRGMGRVEGDLSFSVAAVGDGWIEKCRDESGRLGWVPVDRPKMRLTERVLSLVAVDYLLRPAEWLGTVVVCDVCGTIDFDALGRERGTCRLHRGSSGQIAV